MTGRRDLGKLMVLIGTLVAFPLLILPFCPQDRGQALFFLLPALFSMAAAGGR